jgi:hypothetical protein
VKWLCSQDRAQVKATYLELGTDILLYCAINMGNVDLRVILELGAKLTPCRS